MSDVPPPPDDDASEPSTSRRFGAQLLDRVSKAKEQAASAAAQVKNQASVKASAMGEQVALKANDLKEVGVTKVLEILGDFNAAVPILAEAGYVLNHVDIALGLSPKVVASFTTSADVSIENVERLMTEHADKRFTLLLMKSLHQAWQLQSKVKIGNLKARGINVELGLAPTVVVRFA